MAAYLKQFKAFASAFSDRTVPFPASRTYIFQQCLSLASVYPDIFVLYYIRLLNNAAAQTKKPKLRNLRT